MNVQLNAKIEPFTVPDTVSISAIEDTQTQNHIFNGPKLPLHALDVNTLLEMCDEFRTEVFKKANKKRPAVCAGN